MIQARCAWAEGSDAAMQHYHDTEWGVPQHDDTALFEFLTLEGAQAGLSWRTILARRDAYREAFHGFDVDRVARMRDAALEKLLTASRIIRNRQKVWSVRTNAQATLRMAEAHGSLTPTSGRSWTARRSSTAGPSPARSPPPRRSPTA